MKQRLYDLIYKLFGIKGFIWMVGTGLLISTHLDSSSWMMLSVGVGGLNVAQKIWVNK